MWTRSLLNVLLPAVCPLCLDHDGAEICAACAATLPPIEHPCPWCAAPSLHQRCHHCNNRGFAGIARVHVPFTYFGGMERLITTAKAKGRPAAVQACAELLAPLQPTDAAAVVAIPETPGRRTGPHLATALAKRLSRILDIPLLPALQQTRRPKAQHALHAAARARNVEGLFYSSPVPAHIILVDDIITSGATASAAAASLRLAGAKHIELFALARTPHASDAPPAQINE